MKYLLQMLVVCGVFFVNVALAAEAPQKSSYDYWNEADKTRQQVKTLRKTDPQAAAKVLLDAIEEVRDSNVAADFFTTLGEIYVVDLKQPEEALKLYERALPLFEKPETKVPSYHYLTMIAYKVQALIATKKLDEAEKLLQANHAALNEAVIDQNPYSKYAARLMLQAQLGLLEAQGKGAESTTALTQFLLENPRYITLSGKAGDWDDGGYALRELLARLQQQKRGAEALGWGKLAYRLSAFDKNEIENATRLLNGIWAEQENFPAIAQFSKSQSDAAVPSPLSKVALPEIPATLRENLQKQIAELEGRQVMDFGPNKARDIINLHLLLGTPGDLRGAMSEAYQMLKKRPDLQDGSLQICRVFKAADGNLIRANNFLSYLEGNGENPIPAFLAEKS